MALFFAALPIEAAEASAAFQLLSRLRERFPETDFRTFPTLVPRKAFADVRFDGTVAGCKRLAKRIQQVMGAVADVETRFLNAGSAAELARTMRSRTEGKWRDQGAAGVYYHPGGETGGEGDEPAPPLVLVDLERFAGQSPETLVAVLAHEYSHHLLMKDGAQDEQGEEMADLLPVLYGFGVAAANSAFTYFTSGEQVGYMAWHSWRAARFGYLREDTLAFALGVTVAWKAERSRAIQGALGPAVQDCFRKTLRFLGSRRFTWWDAPADRAEDLGAWLERKASATRERRAPPEPAITRVDVRWAGTFVGEAEVVHGEDGAEWYHSPAVDYGKETRVIHAQEGVYFGLAYRLISNHAEQAFSIVEAVAAADWAPGGTGEAAPEGVPCCAHAAVARAGEEQLVLWPSDDPRVPRPCRVAVRLLQGEQTLHQVVFSLE